MKNIFTKFFLIAGAVMSLFLMSCADGADDHQETGTAVNLNVTNLPAKTTYKVGEEFDRTGLKAYLVYENGSVKEVSDEIVVTNFRAELPGTFDCVLTYFDGTKTYSAIIKITIESATGDSSDSDDEENNIEGLKYITVQQKPSKIVYYEGDEALDPEGLEVFATFADSTKSRLVTSYELSGFDSTMTTSYSSEKRTITVSFTSAGVTKTTTFDITINQLSLEKIEVTTLPSKIKYELNEQFSSDGLVVKATFNSGLEKEVTDYTLSDFDSSKIATVPVTVSYIYKNKAYEDAMADKDKYADEYVDYINSMYTKTAEFYAYVKYMNATYTFTEQIEKLSAGTDGSAGTAAEYVLFGDMPQTIKAADVVVNTVAEENGYYIGSDGNYYAMIQENSVSGTFYEDIEMKKPFNITIKYSDGTEAKTKADESYAYFKVEPVKWRVAKNYNGTTKSLLVSEKILDSDLFYYIRNTRFIDGRYVYASNYEHSTIRNYLNGLGGWKDRGLIDRMFTETSKALISITEVVNDGESTQDHLKNELKPADGTVKNSNDELVDYTCANTNDKLFLLSINDITNEEYGFAPTTELKGYDYPNLDTRKKYGTDYALANYLYYDSRVSDNEASPWWTRSPAEDSRLPNGVAASDTDQNTYVHIHITTANGNTNTINAFTGGYGIVPALCVESF